LGKECYKGDKIDETKKGVKIV